MTQARCNTMVTKVVEEEPTWIPMISSKCFSEAVWVAWEIATSADLPTVEEAKMDSRTLLDLDDIVCIY